MDFVEFAQIVVLAPLAVIVIYIVAKTIATAYFSARRYYDEWRYHSHKGENK